MKIKKFIDQIPGGLMLIPLFLGALCNTFFPGGGKYLGSFSNGLISGTYLFWLFGFFV